MFKSKSFLKRHLIPNLLFLIYFGLCIVFYIERSTFIDSGNYLFNILNSDYFFTPHTRWAAALPQAITVLISQLKINPHIEFLTHSISYPLFYYCVFLFILKNTKHIPAAYSILFLLLLGVKHSFFNIVYEMQLAIVFACLYYAYLDKVTEDPTFRNWGVLILSLVLCLFSHIQVLPLLLILITYNFVNHKSIKIIIINMTIVLGLFGLKIYNLPTGYERGQISTLEVVLSRLTQPHTLTVISNYLTTNYFFPLHVFGLFATILLAKRKQYTKAFTLIAAYVSYILFISIMTPGDRAVVIEKHFMPLSIIIGIPLFQHLSTIQFFNKSLSPFYLITAFCCFGYVLIDSGKNHSNRLLYQKELLSKLPYKGKFYADRNLMPQKTIKGLWGFGVESILLSYLNNSQPNSVIHLKSEVPLPPNNKNTFMLTNRNRPFEIKDLNKARFSIDSTMLQVGIPEKSYPKKEDWQ